MVIFAGGDGLVAFCRSLVRWEVILDRGVEGGKAGKEGVKSPYFGSGSQLSIQHPR